MINTLHIKNIGIINEISIELNKGFNVLTGETGAGKTLIIDSLEILAGGRFSKEMIRSGEEYSFVEMQLTENEEDIIISREINISGKNMCKINGRMVTVNELKKFMSKIIDIHGQHDNQYILDTSSHIKYLDEFSKQEIAKVKSEYINLYDEYLKIKEELQQNYGDDKEKQRKLDLLKYQVNEIEMAKLKENEEEQLEDTRKIMLNTEKISENLNQADMKIGVNAIDSINIAIKCLEKIENLDNKYSKTLETLREAYYNLEEVARDINDYKEMICFDDNKRNEVETRLDDIYSLKRKYGNNISEILLYKEEIANEIEKIENLEEHNIKLKEELKEKENKMNSLAEQMHEIRVKNAEILNKNINKELADLEMKNAKFKANVEYSKDGNYTINGLDKVEFYICTNLDEQYKPLAKIASGGEMSRVMLGIKTVLANMDNIETLVFDEIDTGISGMTAKSVAEKMKLISKKHQVLCITHLASIAAKGDYNYYISKNIKEGRMQTRVKQLNEEETIEEIARIASGDITEISIEHAKKLRVA